MRTPLAIAALAAFTLGTLTVPAGPAAAKAAPKSAARASKSKPPAAKGPKMAVCCVCAVKEGKKVLEPVKASVKYKGKTYYFCNLKDKAEFISNPSKYAGAVK
jgi:YHS domain-containing protein